MSLLNPAKQRPAAVTAPANGGMTTLQGIEVASSAINPKAFFALTRRHTLLEKNLAWDNQQQDTVELRKSDILSSITVRFVGTLTVSGTAGQTATVSRRWPYDWMHFKFSANGASNLINCNGLKLKARELMKKVDLNDRGVSQTVGSTVLTQGTLARATEAWGAPSGATALAIGSYPVELEWEIPVAESDVDLVGAIFLSTSTADLTLVIDYLNPAMLFGGTAAVALTGNTQVVSKKFSIPTAGNQIIVPDLSRFHSVIEAGFGGLINGDNEVRLIGQGGGKQLLRCYYTTANNSNALTYAPLVMNDANYGQQLWRYGNNETPDTFPTGGYLRTHNEEQYNSDIGGVWGVGCHEFASEFEFRDVVDMGTTTDLRILVNIANSVTLSNAKLEYVTETLFVAGQAA